MGIFSKGNIGGFLGGAVAGVPGAVFGALQGRKMDAAEAARAGFDPYSGQPLYPDYIGMSDAELMGHPGALGQRYNAEAMRTGPSRGADLAMAEQRRTLGMTRDQLKAQALGEAAQAKNALAMKGGLSSGAAERVNTNMGSRALELGQQARQGYAKNLADIGMEDEGNRQKMLMGAAGLESQTQNSGLGRVQNQNLAKNKFNLDRYGSQMSSWAAGKQAEATKNSGKKS